MTSTNVLIICIFTYVCASVTCIEDEQIKISPGRLVRQRYRYNHPPSAEDGEIIPVAVIYDKVVDSNEKKSKNNRKVEITTGTTIETDTKIIEQVTITDDVKRTSNRRRIRTKGQRQRINPKIQNETREEIPVTIAHKSPVYTDEQQLMKTSSDHLKHEMKIAKQKDETSTAESKDIKSNNNVAPKLENVSVSNSVKQSNEVSVETTKQLQLELKIPVSVVYDEDIGLKNNFQPVIRRNGAKNRVITKVRKNVTILSNQPSKNMKNILSEVKINTQPIEDSTETSSVEAKNNGTHQKRTREKDPVVPIIESENRLFSQTGEFAYSYEGGDGTKAFSSGVLKTFDEDRMGEAVIGGFSYKDKDGNDFSLSYTADENGYRPVGAHLPTPPPIPPAIARALAHLATKTTPAPVTEALDSD